MEMLLEDLGGVCHVLSEASRALASLVNNYTIYKTSTKRNACLKRIT